MFSQRTEYALRAMAWLSLNPDGLTPTGVLADAISVPPQYLAKVLRRLGSARLIRGRRGARGGYRLARPPGEITVLEVVNAVAPLERLAPCPIGASIYPGALCPLHNLLDRATEGAIRLFAGVTLHDLAQESETGKPVCDVPAGPPVTVTFTGTALAGAVPVEL